MILVGGGVAALLLGTVFAPTAAQARRPVGSVIVVASGLNNPRGLAIAPDGEVLVAEAGTGGGDCVSGGPEGDVCVGRTGSISRVRPGRVVRFITGLVSGAGRDGTAAEGAVAISARGPNGVFVQFAGNTLGIPVDQFTPAHQAAIRTYFGQTTQIAPNGHHLTPLAGVGDFDYRWSQRHSGLNPQFPDSNPNAILAVPGSEYVIDAGANTLDRVHANGHISVVTYFPVPDSAPSDSVPTCVAKGPDGALYVGELLGGYFNPGTSRVWRVVPGQAPTVWKSGFSAINGCGFDSAGNFYATEFQSGGLAADSPAGDVIKITPSGQRTVLGTGKLFTPSGFAPGPNGSIYVSNWSILPGNTGGGPTGQLVRIITS